MAIRLAFMINREIIHFLVEGKTIRYYDRKWKNGIQFMPKDEHFMLRLLGSRNRFPMAKQIIQWVNLANSGKNLQEYENAKTDEELAEIIRKDAKGKGLVEVKVND